MSLAVRELNILVYFHRFILPSSIYLTFTNLLTIFTILVLILISALYNIPHTTINIPHSYNAILTLVHSHPSYDSYYSTPYP